MRLLTGAALAATLGLGACGTTSNQSMDDFITTMSHTNCHVTMSIAATVGAVNPGSGAQFQAQADCPNGTGPAPVTATNGSSITAH